MNTDYGAGLPQLSDVVAGWSRPITVKLLSQEMFDGDVVKTETLIDAMGVIQPFTAAQLLLKPEGERTWDWQALHVLPPFDAKLGDRVEIFGTRYRIMSRKDYMLYGYLKYELVEDFTND